MKKKIIAAVVLVLLLAAGILARRHTTLLEQIPEEAWDGELSFIFLAGFATEDNRAISTQIQITAEDLQEVFSDVHLLHAAAPNDIGICLRFFKLELKSGENEYVLYVRSNGEVTFTQPAPDEEDGDKKRWYWDEGRLYQ